MKKISKNTKKVSILFTFILLCVGLITILAYSGMQNLQSEAEIVGKNTFYQTITQADGSIVDCYASGDEYFNYLHDEEGYILINDGDYVYYAKNKDGRPTASGIRYDGSQEEIENLAKMAFSDIDFAKNSDLISDYPRGDSPSSSLINPTGTTNLANLIIYICFADDEIPDLSGNPYDSYLNGEGNSLRDYYYQLSYGRLSITNVNSYSEGVIACFQDYESRSYYYNCNDSQRENREKTLLNRAVNSVKGGLALDNIDIDVDDDGYVDAVSFLVSGSPTSAWSGLLWPHSWDLNYLSGGNPARINNIKVKDYSFNFLDQLTVGLLCHEVGHVLGCPDLYHYDDDNNFSSVGVWDLMHYEGDTPQYMTVHMRDKYLGFVGNNQIVDISYNGVFSLKPATVATTEDVLAYRIGTGKDDEHIMVEYRNNAVTNYDSELPGSGLLIYRIKDGIDGNERARWQSSTYPDELYVYRPSVAKKGTIQTKSNTDLSYAYLSPNNSNFSSVGQVQTPSSYSYETLYYTDGSNTMVSISAVSISDEEITFNVRLNGSDSVDDEYFTDKLELNEIKLKNDSSFSGVYAELKLTKAIDVTALADIIVTLEDEAGRTVNSVSLNKTIFNRDVNNGITTFPVRYIVNAKGNTLSGAFSQGEWITDEEPVKMKLSVVDADNDYITLGSFDIAANGQSWERIQQTNAKPKLSVAASNTATAVVREDGNMYISATNVSSMPTANVIAVGAGAYHVLYITKDFRVYSVGSDLKGEGGVSVWSDIIKVDGGEYTSYGLSLNGHVYALGNNEYNQLDVNSWTDIVDISAGKRHVVGLKSDGTVVAVGNDMGNQVSGVDDWTNIISVVAGDNYTAGLKSDGTVVYCGSIAPTKLDENRQIASSIVISTWTGVKKLAGGSDFLLALFEDGKVRSTGKNTSGQCGTIGASGYVIPFKDIIELAGGEQHSAFLREDGKLLFLGANNGTNNITENLIYYDNYVEPEEIVLPMDRLIVKVGGSYSVACSIMPLETTYKKVDYISNNDHIAEVDENGVITGIAVGEVVIVISHRGKSTVKKQLNVTVIESIITTPMIATGDSHTLVLGADGTVYAKGSSQKNQLDVFLWGNIIGIAARGNVSLGVTNENTVKMAGSVINNEVLAWTDIVAVATDGEIILGLKSDNSVVSAFQYGENNNGRASLNTSDWLDITALSVSRTHTLGLTSAGRAVAKGENHYRQLEVSAWTKLVQVAAGNNFSLGLRSDGTVYYIGESLYFNISDIAEWTDIIDISAGLNSVAAVDSHGKVFALGFVEDVIAAADKLTEMRMISASSSHLIGITGGGDIVGVGKNNDGRLDFNNIGELSYIPVVDTSFEATGSIGVKLNSTVKICMEVTPYNATDRKNITYSTDNVAIATVDENGVLTGVGNGTTQVTATIQLRNDEYIMRTCAVVVYSMVSSLRLQTPPTKTLYAYGDALDLSGSKISVSTPSGNFSTALTKDMIFDYNNVTSATQYDSQYINQSDRTKRTVVIRLDDSGITATFVITVKNKIKEIEVGSFPSKLDYVFGESLDLSGLILLLRNADGGTTSISYQDLLDKIAANEVTLIGGTSKLAVSSVTIIYNDVNFENNQLSVSFDITVYDKIKAIHPMLDKYEYGYAEELEGGIRIEMCSGLFDTVLFNEIGVGISNYNYYVLGSQRIKLSYTFEDVEGKPESVSGTGVYEVETDVTVSDSISYFEITSETFVEEDKGTVLVYEVGGQLNLSARVYFESGAEMNAPFSVGSETYLRICISDGTMTGQGYGSTTVTVEAQSYLQGISGKSYTPLIPTLTEFNSTFATFGLANVTGISIEGSSEFRYGSTTDLRIKITDSGNIYYIRVDDTKLNLDSRILSPQVASVHYFNYSAQKVISFYNYTEELYLPKREVEIVANRNLQDYVTLYAKMADGSSVALSGTLWSHNLNNKSLGVQVVTILYTDLKISTEFEYTVYVNVKDEVKEIQVLTNPNTRVEVYGELDFSDFSIRVTYYINPTETIMFSPDKFSISGFKNDVTGTQTVTITYLVTEDQWEYQVTVTNVIRRIEVDLEKSKIVYSIGEKLSVTVVCIYMTGETEEIDTYIDTFDSSEATPENEYQTVNFTYMDRYTTTFTVRVIDLPTYISITSPTKREYEFGEALNLDGGFVNIVTQDKKNYSVPLSTYISLLNYNSTPAKVGRQTLTVSMKGRDKNNDEVDLSASFTVVVKEISDRVLTIKEESISAVVIDYKDKNIYLKENMTVKDLNLALDSYAKLSYKYDNVDISPTGAGETTNASFKEKVILTGENGSVLTQFTVYRLGDTDGDGLVTSEDIVGIAKLISQNNHSAKYTDFDGDGKTTLKDLVNWVELIKP